MYWRDYIPTSWKKALISGALAGTVGLSVACAKHEPVPPPIITPTPPITAPAPTPAPSPVPIPVDNPPQILSYDMPQEVNAGQEFLGTATATDDYGIERVYVVFRNSEKLETTMEKADGEYKASLKLPSKGEYWYSIGATDTKGQEASIEEKITVFPALDSDENADGLTWELEEKLGLSHDKPNLNVAYALSKNLSDYVELIKPMDADGIQQEKERLAIDTALEISQLNISDDLKRNNIIYLLSKPSEFLDAYNSLKLVSDNTLKDYLELGIDDNLIDYLSFLSTLTNKEFADYALKNKLCIQDKNLTELEKNSLKDPEKYKQQIFEYNLSEINKINPELANELMKLPDFGTVDIKDVEALEDITAFAPYESVGGITLDSMFNEGIKEKRKFCTLVQTLVWGLYDYDKRYLDKKPWDIEIRWTGNPSDLLKFLKWVWVKSSESNNFASDRWKDFNEVADRLNSPMFIATYTRDNFSYIADPYIFQPAERSFKIKGGACSDYSMFGLELLLRNGYEYNNFETHNNNAAVILTAYEKATSFEHSLQIESGGHATTLYVNDGLFYLINFSTINGPFNTIEEAVTRTYRNWETYEFRDINARVTKKVKRIE